MAIIRDRYDYQARAEIKDEVTFEGCVIRVYQKDFQAMSDVYTYATFADVWNEASQKVEAVLVNANFECDISKGRAAVDATPDVLTKVEALRLAQEERARLYEAEKAALRERKAARVGREMKLTATVKGVKKGTVVVVAYIYEGRRALCKDPTCSWQDRTTPGFWVNINSLEGVV